MTKIYLSSTYDDLAEYRGIVVQTIMKMNAIVVGMETYTASDERPLDRCLLDVAACDLYLGIFGFRYGFVPRKSNPKGLSITELEYREAKRRKKKCLVFLADERRWPMIKSDHYTGENKQGLKIEELRDRLALEHLRALFDNPYDLAASVSTSIANVRKGHSSQKSMRSAQTRRLGEAAIAIADYFREIDPAWGIISFSRIQDHLNSSWSDTFLERVAQRYPLSFRLTWTTTELQALKYTGKRPRNVG